MFFNSLMGASEGNHGEIVNKVKDNLWQSNRGTLFWLVEPDLCQSSTGVYYRRTGLNVYGSDGNWFSSLDVFEEKNAKENAKENEQQRPPSNTSNPQATTSSAKPAGCMPILVLLAIAALIVVFR